MLGEKPENPGITTLRNRTIQKPSQRFFMTILTLSVQNNILLLKKYQLVVYKIFKRTILYIALNFWMIFVRFFE